VRVDFLLSIEHTDPALGREFFPISDLTGKIVNITSWREES
jgi:hypothetical protein